MLVLHCVPETSAELMGVGRGILDMNGLTGDVDSCDEIRYWGGRGGGAFSANEFSLRGQSGVGGHGGQTTARLYMRDIPHSVPPTGPADVISRRYWKHSGSRGGLLVPWRMSNI
ncbi:hypothetical protein DPEC_G00124880 [Dallia pectoralis]|uniref:Uncharacterized protein n=1 Tax=Dallia pectoralis TaxID=75939 RepID=A0ACC2GRR6_DALPE|nr:hypothetical protein DPEC_G00124880 [Dallia pectoralis]